MVTIFDGVVFLRQNLWKITQKRGFKLMCHSAKDSNPGPLSKYLDCWGGHPRTQGFGCTRFSLITLNDNFVLMYLLLNNLGNFPYITVVANR